MIEKVIVTGGAGFIGSHLVEELVGRGFSVTVLDDLSTGKRDNIEGMLLKKNVDFIQGSVTDLPLLLELFQGVQYIFHLAALTSVSLSLDSPKSSHEVNITGTLNVLLSARDNHVNKVIYASSASVYGDTQAPAEREDMLPSPLSPYAVTKLAGEYYCRVFHQVYGLPTICLRYFNVYGPRQDPNSQYAAVIPRFIKRNCENNPPIIYGDGEQSRDFVFVKDAVEATILAAQSDNCGPFNIGCGESITIKRLAELIMELVGNKVEPIHQEPMSGDIRHSLADISKAKAFGYEPKCDLKAGLAKTIREFRGK